MTHDNPHTRNPQALSTLRQVNGALADGVLRLPTAETATWAAGANDISARGTIHTEIAP